VLDKGEVAEFDTPTALLANERSVFYSMAKDAGLVKGQSTPDTDSGSDADASS